MGAIWRLNYSGGFSEEHAFTRIKDSRMLPYIRRTFAQVTNLHGIRLDQWKYIRSTSNFTVPERVVERLEIDEKKYVEFCRKELSAACAMLRSLLDIIMQLRWSIVDATLNATWNNSVLEALRLRMSGIQVHINQVCSILDVPHLRLMSATNPWW